MTDAHAYQWILAIEGLPDVYLSHGLPGGLPSSIVSRSTAEQHARAIRTRGVTVSTPESLDLQSSEFAGGSYRVGLVNGYGANVDKLLRLGVRGAERRLTLAADIPQTSATGIVISVVGDLTGWNAGDLCWLGLECFDIQTITPGTPHTLSVNRGQYDSRRRSHNVEAPVSGGAPTIYSDCVRWRHRGARLYRADTRGAPAAGDWTQVVNGYIREVPTFTGSGPLQIDVVVTPWQCGLTQGVASGSGLATLQRGWHFFDGSNGCSVSIGSHQFKQGHAFRDYTGTVTPPSGISSRLMLGWGVLAEYFDPQMAPAYKQGDIIIDGARWQLDNTAPGDPFYGTGTDRTTDEVDLTASAVPLRGLARWVENADAVAPNIEATIYNSPALKRWPDEFLTDFEAEFGYVGSGGGASWVGQWWMTHDLARDETGWQLGSRLTGTLAPPKGGTVHIHPPPPGSQWLWYGLDLAAPESIILDRRSNSSARDETWASREIEVQAYRQQSSSEPQYTQIRGLPDAYYQTGEPFMWLDVDLTGGGGITASGYLQASWTESDGSARAATIRHGGVIAASILMAGAPGYIYTILRPSEVLSIGAWAGQDPPVFSATGAWDKTDVRDVLLQTLMSSEGDGFTSSTYDVLPWGLGLTASEVDIASFTNAPAVGTTAFADSYQVEPGSSLSDLVAGILQTNSLAITQRLDSSGLMKIACVSTSALPLATDSSGSILTGIWTPDGRPETAYSEPMENRLVVTTTSDPVSGETKRETTLVSLELQRENGNRDASFEIAAPWLYLSVADTAGAQAALTPVALERWALFGHPRLALRGRVGISTAEDLYVGCVVYVQAPDAASYTGVGVSTFGRVVELARDYDASSADVSVILADALATGHAPGMRVASIINATVLTTEANRYAPTTNTMTGVSQRDSDFFTAGDLVVGTDLANVATAANLTIQSISTTTPGLVAFTGTHGLSVGDDIYPRPSGSNPSSLDLFAFFDVGQDYS